MNKYQLHFFITSLGTPQVNSLNCKYNVISYLSNFVKKEQLEAEVIPFAKEVVKENQIICKEWVEPIGGFIRINYDKTKFGQYLDENLAELDQFKDYLDKGEKIFGEISTKDFVDIVEAWVAFLKKPSSPLKTGIRILKLSE